MRVELCCPCMFGLESILAFEVKKIGGEDVRVSDGKVTFCGDLSLVIKANLWLRTAERVQLVLGSFTAKSFTELFDQTVELPFEQFIGKSDAFPVKGWALNSQLHSVPDCQSIIKKAAVKRLEKCYGVSWFQETGAPRQIMFSILKDEVTIMLDTSGPGLHKRGYRQNSTEAPLKETLAAGIADLARVKADSFVCDPFCGSGTLLIEAALRALNIAPGIRRHFACEKWGVIPEQDWKTEREAAMDLIDRQAKFSAVGYDIDADAVELTKQNAMKAGVGVRIKTAQADIKQLNLSGENAILLCNPPYGERLLDKKQSMEIYRTMGTVMPVGLGKSYYIITPCEEFEQAFGRKANKRRKLFNGGIRCQLYSYFNLR